MYICERISGWRDKAKNKSTKIKSNFRQNMKGNTQKHMILNNVKLNNHILLNSHKITQNDN